ncbi:AraC family transcriptional regulator [Rhodanobacter sp. DHB23]|uniref:helix-turn-helix transcriptional regulator n=1 Tax=Rhodanobacter sp. DHB23 TaxID=2775923 RepID=UPI001CE07EC7|nr:AraC family transcriptional regulator [Rhodanobacter sp. DHB23]
MRNDAIHGERFPTSFRIREPTSFLAGMLDDTAITISECRSTVADSQLSIPFPADDAYIAGLQLQPYDNCESWEQGRCVARTNVVQGHTHLYDVKRDPRFLIDKPIHVLMFYVPRGALDAVAKEARAQPLGELSYQAGIGHDDEVMRQLGNVMRQALRAPEQAGRLFVDHVTLALTVHIAHTYGGLRHVAPPNRGGLAGWQRKRACEVLDAHLNGGMPLQQVAAECGISTGHFSRAFRLSMGITPHAWLMRRRVDVATSLMRDGKQTLAAIALASGFADQSHLTRVFTRAMGVSPGEWRRHVVDRSIDVDE